MCFDHRKSLYLSTALLVVLLTVGFCLSQRKIFWNDEIFSQQTAIDADSYWGILTFKFPDGNKHPLFYVVQKTFSSVFSCHLPPGFSTSFYATHNMRLQTIMRIPANIYMSLGLALIFYFFTRFYSIYAGLYALVVALISPMVWMYWAEARPYSLWFMLTCAQLLLFASLFVAPKVRTMTPLFWTHLLLALTAPASMFQMTIIAFWAWIKKKYSLKEAVWIWIIPMAVDLFYYHFDYVEKIKTYMFIANLYDVVMPERLFFYIGYALVIWGLPEKYKKYSWNVFFFPVFLLFLAVAVGILFIDLFTQNSAQGFFSRYLIFVTPADILMFTFASLDLRRWSRPHFWLCMNVMIVIAGLVMLRALMTYREILSTALYLHAPGP